MAEWNEVIIKGAKGANILRGRWLGGQGGGDGGIPYYRISPADKARGKLHPNPEVHKEKGWAAPGRKVHSQIFFRLAVTRLGVDVPGRRYHSERRKKSGRAKSRPAPTGEIIIWLTQRKPRIHFN